MDDNRRLSAARVAELGQINQAFLTSVDESDNGRQEISLKVISSSSDENIESGSFTKTSGNERESWLSSSPVPSEKYLKEEDKEVADDLNATDRDNTSFMVEKNGNCREESSSNTPYGVTSCEASQPNQSYQGYDRNLNNETSSVFGSSIDDLVDAKPQERMKECLESRSQKQENPVQLTHRKGKERSKGVSQNDFTSIELGLHKDEIQDGGNMNSVPCNVAVTEKVNEKDPDNSAFEIGDLDISVRSDATEFFYTPDISPTRSPINGYVEHKRGVKFSEKNIEIGQDMLVSSFDQCDENVFTDERVVGCLDQEYLRRMVDPNSQFFVCTLLILEGFR